VHLVGFYYKNHSFIYTLLLPEGQVVKAWEPSFGTRRALDGEVLPPFVSCLSSSCKSTRYMLRAAQYTKFVAPSCADVTTGHAACLCYLSRFCSVANIDHFAASDYDSLCCRFVLIVQCACSSWHDDLCFVSPAGTMDSFSSSKVQTTRHAPRV
jgi:hypothetical protein